MLILLIQIPAGLWEGMERSSRQQMEEQIGHRRQAVRVILYLQ